MSLHPGASGPGSALMCSSLSVTEPLGDTSHPGVLWLPGNMQTQQSGGEFSLERVGKLQT